MGSILPRKMTRGIEVGIGKRRLEIGEHVELGGQRGALVHVLAVAAGPEEALPLRVLDAGEIDLAALENGLFLLGEILADDGHNAHRRELARRQRKITGRAAERAVHLAEGRFNRIKRHRTDNQK